jgi:rRNA biogenesis protein RRP5
MAPPNSKKRSQPGGSSPSAKKARTGIKGSDRAERAKPAPMPSFKSSLLGEEVDFPRGGGSSLTAFETKQARNEGMREAEAEDGKPQKKVRSISDRHAKRIKKSSSAKDAERVERDKDTIRVEELSYKRLVPGTLVLARIHTVLPLHLVVSLPNHLLAHVPITEVSKTLTAALNADMDAMSEDGSDKEDDEEETPDLADIFTPGQYFPARVVTVFPTASQAFIAQYPVSEMTRLAARAELTLVPEKINTDIAKADLAKGFKIAGEVLSKEDKGYRVGLGFGSDAGLAGVEGFISNEEVEQAGASE